MSRAKIRLRVFYFFSAFVVVATLFAAPFLSSPLAQAKTISSMTLEEEATSATYYTALSKCVADPLYSEIKTSVGTQGNEGPLDANWFDTGGLFSPDNTFTVFDGQKSVERDCKDIVGPALQLWGWGGDYKAFLTELGYTYDSSLPGMKRPVDNTDRLNKFWSAVQNKVYKSSFNLDFNGRDTGYRAPMSEAAEYVLFKQFTETCTVTTLGLFPNGIADQTERSLASSGGSDGSTVYTKKPWLGPDKRVGEYGLKYVPTAGAIPVYGEPKDGSTSGAGIALGCTNIIDEISAKSSAYATHLATVACEEAGVMEAFPGGSAQLILRACAEGNQNDSLTFCSTSYGSQSDLRKACYIGQGNEAAEACILLGFSANNTLRACIAGSLDKTDGYCDTTYADTLSNSQPVSRESERRACVAGQAIELQFSEGIEIDAGLDRDCSINPDAEGCEQTATSCAIAGIGWLLCPSINFLAGVGDSAFTALSDNFLKTDVDLVSTDPKNGTYIAWQYMRNFANVGFVLVFMVIIFSQLTSTGISNYGVKKMLPRLVIAAILVNISFFISQILVDLSNILGFGIRDLFDSIASEANNAYSRDDPIGSVTGDSLLGLFGGILGVGTTVAFGYFAISGGSVVLIAAVLALLLTLLILIVRQVVIVIAVILAPLAFVAWILPNTEKLFTQWWKIFLQLLLVFPIVSFVFGATILISAVLAGVAVANDDMLWQIIAALMPALGLFLVIPLIRGSLKAVPALGAFASKMNGKAGSGLTKKLGESYRGSTLGKARAIRKHQRNVQLDKSFAKTIGGTGFVSKAAKVMGSGVAGLKFTEGQKAEVEALERAASGTAAAAQSEAVKQEMIVLREKFGTDRSAIKTHIQTGYSNMTDVQVEAAHDLLLEAKGTEELRELIADPGLMSRHGYSVVQSMRRNSGTVRESAIDMANWAGTKAASEGRLAYSATSLDSNGKPFIQAAYGSAQASKLISMDGKTAELAEKYIDKDSAKTAVGMTESFGNANKTTKDIIVKIANQP